MYVSTCSDTLAALIPLYMYMYMYIHVYNCTCEGIEDKWSCLRCLCHMNRICIYMYTHVCIMGTSIQYTCNCSRNYTLWHHLIVVERGL